MSAHGFLAIHHGRSELTQVEGNKGSSPSLLPTIGSALVIIACIGFALALIYVPHGSVSHVILP